MNSQEIFKIFTEKKIDDLNLKGFKDRFGILNIRTKKFFFQFYRNSQLLTPFHILLFWSRNRSRDESSRESPDSTPAAAAASAATPMRLSDMLKRKSGMRNASRKSSRKTSSGNAGTSREELRSAGKNSQMRKSLLVTGITLVGALARPYLTYLWNK